MRKSKYGYLKLMKLVTGIAFQRLPAVTVCMMICSVVAAVAQSAGVWFKQLLFDSAQALAEGGAAGRVYLAGFLLGVFIILQLVLNALGTLAENKFNYKMEQAAGSLMNEKAAKIDPICYEDNKFLDHIERADRGMQGAVVVFCYTWYILVTFLCYFGFMGIYLFTLEPGLMIMLLISFIPYIVGGVVRYQVRKKLEYKAAPYRRRGDFYGRCITDREYAKETRLLGAYGYFFRKFEENIRMVKELDWQAIKKNEAVEISLRFISMTGYIGTIVLLFYYLMTGRVGVGAFAAIASSLDGMSDKLDNLFRVKVKQLTSNIGMAENYMEFLNLPEREDGRVFPDGRTVEFSHVSFCYPEAAGEAISDISLCIKEKETIAIVGSNGAGKSTFAKLLLGIYQPTKGNVRIDGVDTRELNPRNSSGHISAVFQKFQRYKMSLRENVILSESGKPTDEAMLKKALEKADLDWKSAAFPDGLHTMLSREFGGTDLSGGQWQRLAIARGFYRRHNLIVLDEPTAAIDPLEETAVYQKFAEMSKDKTAVIITHRLGSVKIADRIVVLENGKIAEMGRHEALMEKKGLYYDMYMAQAKWYA